MWIAPTLTISRAATNAYLLTWSAVVNQQFQVQYATNPPPGWLAFTNVVSSTNGNFTFTDDGSQTRGFGSRRFYQLKRLP